MKKLPKLPYLQNIVIYYHTTHKTQYFKSNYRDWLSQFGFRVPVEGDYLEFPNDFSDKDITLFVLKWS